MQLFPQPRYKGSPPYCPPAAHSGCPSCGPLGDMERLLPPLTLLLVVLLFPGEAELGPGPGGQCFCAMVVSGMGAQAGQ